MQKSKTQKILSEYWYKSKYIIKNVNRIIHFTAFHRWPSTKTYVKSAAPRRKMDNSNKPSPSNVQDAGKKEGLAKKMKAAKAPVKMQKSPKKVGLPKNLVNFKKSSKEVTKKSLAKTPTKKSTTSPHEDQSQLQPRLPGLLDGWLPRLPWGCPSRTCQSLGFFYNR